MSRPRVIKLEDGEVSLQGFSTERADALVKLLRNPPTVNPTDNTVIGSLPDLALGFRKNEVTKSYELIKIKYNADDKTSKVEEVIPVGETKMMATNEFKKEVIRNRMF